jgi:ketosteroid isomerase-like protein
VSFDIVPPLQHVGAESKRHNWVETFAIYQRPLGYEIHNLTIIVGNDVACRIAHDPFRCRSIWRAAKRC